MDHETLETSGKRGEDEEKDDGEDIIEASSTLNSTTLTHPPTAPAETDQFIHTPGFKRHFVEFFHVQTLMSLRCATKGWNAAADALIGERVESGAMIVYDGKNISNGSLATRVIFLLNITKVRDYACYYAANLVVVVDIPDGVESIGKEAFEHCSSLTAVYFPTTLTSIGWHAFENCISLEKVDLLHTNLKELGDGAFGDCSGQKTMTIWDSLQTIGDKVFRLCSKLVPYNMYGDEDAIVAHLRKLQLSTDVHTGCNLM